MIKIFLVEDEIVMREGIKNNIEWEKEGFEFVGEASDGELALPLIQKTQPDILITDIKMPFMDGLELSRLVKQEYPDTKIIFLSGYDEFEYAREAIKIGIAEYLVKPISGVQLLESVKKVGELITWEKQQKMYLHRFEEDQEEGARIARGKLFQSLISGKRSVSELLKEGRQIGIELAAEKYNIILFQIFFNDEKSACLEEQNDIIKAVEKIVEEKSGILLGERETIGWMFLLKETEEESLEFLEKTLLERLCELAKSLQNVDYFGGVGEPVLRLSELNKCFGKASRAFAYRYLKPYNQIIYSREAEHEEVEDKALELSTLNVEKLNRNVIESFLKTGAKSEAQHFIEDYFKSLGEKNVQSRIFRQYVVMDLYLAAIGVVEQLGYEPDDLINKCDDIDITTVALSNIQAAKKYLSKMFEETLELREAVSRKKYNALLAEAKMYIQNNFSNEDISLNTVAAKVNLSPNHFSSIFSQEIGQTFIEYLTHVRMERAKELLRSTSMRNTEIAQEVGYKDAHYFSYLFKKTVGCTPKEFRAVE